MDIPSLSSMWHMLADQQGGKGFAASSAKLEGLASLPPGHLLQGKLTHQQVVQTPGGGNTTLSLLSLASGAKSYGNLAFTGTLNVPVGTELQLRVQHNSVGKTTEAGQFTLQATQQRTPGGGASASLSPAPVLQAVLGQGTGAAVTTGAVASKGPLIDQAAASTLRATVIQAAPSLPGAVAPLVPGGGALPVGTSVQLQIQQVIPPEGGAPPVPGAGKAATATVPPAVTTGANATSQATSQATSSYGKAVQATSAAGSAASGLPPVPASSALWTATVSEVDPAAGLLRLQSPLGTLQLPHSTALPVGTQLQVVAMSVHLPQGAQPAVGTLSLAQVPALLQELAASLQQVQNAEAKPAQALLLPTVTPPAPGGGYTASFAQQFAARALWFMAGVLAGSAEQWLGKDLTQSLKQSREDPSLLPRLNQVFSTLQKAWAEPNPSGWHSIPVPLWDGQEAHTAWFHLHRDPKGQKQTQEAPQQATRFMVEVHLDQMGEVQMDGLFHAAAGPKKPAQIDLVLRTHQPLSDVVGKEMTALFHAVLEAGGLTGSLLFEVVEDFPAHPLHEEQAGGEGVVI